jgi:4-amino-4-deoxy-L-arabinose transferase-like glycosyltransferase
MTSLLIPVNSMSRLLRNKSLFVILLLALLIRLTLLITVLVKNPDGIYVYDSYGYWNLGYNMFHNGAFSQNDDVPLDPDYYRTPVYPVFIAFAELTGPEGVSVIILQIILSVLTCYFVYRLAEEVTKNRFISNTAALIVALDLPSVAISAIVLTETLFTFLMVLTFYFFTRFLNNGRRKDLICAALFSGLLILCRPVAFCIPVLFSAFILYRSFRTIKVFLRNILLYGGIVFFTLSPWLLRNRITFGHFFISVIREHNLLNYQAAAVYAERYGRPLPESQSILRWKTFREFKGDAYKQPYEYAGFIEKEAVSVIFDSPLIFLKQQVVQVGYFFLKPTCAYFEIQFGHWGKGYNTIPKDYKVFESFFKRTGKVTIVLVLFQVIMLLLVYAACIAGIIFMRRQTWMLPLSLFLLTIVCFAVMNLPPVTEARFRVPVVPLIAIISACGIFYLKENCLPLIRKNKKTISQR